MNAAAPRLGYFPGSDVRNNVTIILDEHLQRDPSRTVLRWAEPAAVRALAEGATSLPHASATVAQLHDRVARTAAGLMDAGIRHGDRVLLFVPMSLHLYTAMFALQRIGAIPVFLDSWARRAHLGVSADIVTARGMISFEKAFELCDGVPELASLAVRVSVGPATRAYTTSLEALATTARTQDAVPVEQEHTALITFTTGSSGKPKGANRTHRFLAAQHYALDACIPYEPSDVDLPVFPIFSLNNIAAGVPTVLPAFDIGTPADRDPAILTAQFSACGVTCTTLSPSLFQRTATWCAEKGITLPHLRRVVTGGAPISRDDLVAFQQIAPHASIMVLFGSTEAEPMAHIEARALVALQSRSLEDPEWVDEGVNVGAMADGLSYKFLRIMKGEVPRQEPFDWSALEVPPGEPGELVVAGEHVCRDYYNDEVAFRRAKVVDDRGVVWHRTGDLGRLDAHGHLWIVGRVHNAIGRAGSYVFPVRAEMVMRKLPFTRQCAYLGVADKTLGERTVCVVVPHEQAAGREEAWRAEVVRILGKHGLPADQIVFRAELPLDPRHHSKVEYDVLRSQLVAEGLA